MKNFVDLLIILNQVYLKIIMFGFLIAMIKGTYDKNQKAETQNKYKARCDMNQVSFNLYKKIPFTSSIETDLVVVSAHFNEYIEIINDSEELWKK